MGGSWQGGVVLVCPHRDEKNSIARNETISHVLFFTSMWAHDDHGARCTSHQWPHSIRLTFCGVNIASPSIRLNGWVMTRWGGRGPPESRRKNSMLTVVDCGHQPPTPSNNGSLDMKRPETHVYGALLPLTWNVNFSSGMSPGVCVCVSVYSTVNRTTCQKSIRKTFFSRGQTDLGTFFNYLRKCVTKLRYNSIYYIFNSSLRSYIFSRLFLFELSRVFFEFCDF